MDPGGHLSTSSPIELASGRLNRADRLAVILIRLAGKGMVEPDQPTRLRPIGEDSLAHVGADCARRATSA
jgi:hypothetical protein